MQFLLSTILSQVHRVSMRGDSCFGVSVGIESSVLVAGCRGRGEERGSSCGYDLGEGHG